ncbi:TlpA family protein disulfide reductase [Caulobacter mirabilis]|uniref:Thiol:disulfide interchange protein n=1 Tax=Caulobacter mirabilis TaxID=69666 RepID=A0A2D2AW24_9CAUL|nr:TlpA disulfide reductase family protein [Caulobacter mirabilis]ATQ42222.1 thiol:disulfide interchange protein [Caulobacter mirabilis]
MSEVQPAKPAPLLKWAIGCFALIGVAAVLYVMVSASFKPKESADLRDLKRGGLAKLEVPATPRPAPTQSFLGPDGKPMTVADLKGQVVVLNLWATWCAPCKVEMPTLAALQAAYQTQPVKVLAVSVDRDVDLNIAKSDMAKNPPLQLYRDPGYKLAFALEPRAAGFPTTIVYDRQGRERARVSGEADWNSKEARELVERLLKEG